MDTPSAPVCFLLLTPLSSSSSCSSCLVTLHHSIRCEGVYCGLALWGDSDNEPTSVLLQMGISTPLFTAITAGSMFGVDVVIDTTARSPTTNVVYLATAGKATAANQFGNGGSFQVWKIVVPK